MQVTVLPYVLICSPFLALFDKLYIKFFSDKSWKKSIIFHICQRIARKGVDFSKRICRMVMSNFSYCPLIWLFCSKVANNEINRTHKHALRTLYRDYESTFEELLDRGDTKTTHKKNLQNLMVEIYKSMNHLNPEYMWDFFVKKDVPYNLRTKELCKLPSVSSQRYGINSVL